MGSSILAFKNLKKHYSPRFSLEIDDLVFEGGKIYAVVGPNGSGKTTLLKLGALLIPPDEGHIYLFGEDIYRVPAGKRTKLRQKISFLHEEPYLFRGTVFDNVVYGLRIRGMKKKEMKKKILPILSALGISPLVNKKARELSAGERKRVALARAVIIEPSLLLLDEPMANIDRGNIGLVEKFIRGLKEQGVTVILSTHDLSQAYRLSDEIISLKDGKMGRFIPDNLLVGEGVIEGEEMFLALPTGTRIALSGEKREGKLLISISPREIILSKKPLDSSARNSFLGRVTKLIEEGEEVKVILDVSGIEFTSIITKRSYHQLGIKIGSKMYLTFKASAVRIL